MRTSGSAIIVFAAIVASVFVQMPVTVTASTECPPTPTERQQSLADGWNSIANDPGDNAPGYYVLSIGDTTVTVADLQRMSEDERRYLADAWVAENDGTDELNDYWTALAECGLPSPFDASITSVSYSSVFPEGFDPVDADRRCDEFAANVRQNWTMLSAEDIELITSCRRNSIGQWFHPAGPDDPRLTTGPILTEDEKRIVEPERSRIETQLADLEALLEATPNPLVRAGQQPHTLLDAVKEASDVNGPRLRAEDLTLWIWQQGYEPILFAHLQNPDNANLATFAYWYFSTAESVASRVSRGINPLAARGIVAFVGRPSLFPVDVHDEMNMALYFRWAIDSGYLVPTSDASTSSAGVAADNCSAIGLWLGGTLERIKQVSTFTRQLPPDPAPALADSLEQSAISLESYIAVQRESDPPTEALAANALIVEWWSQLSPVLAKLAEAARSNDAGAWDDAIAELEQVAEYSYASDAELDALRASCGL